MATAKTASGRRVGDEPQRSVKGKTVIRSIARVPARTGKPSRNPAALAAVALVLALQVLALHFAEVP